MDQGLHKSVCKRVVFPNAKMERIDSFYDQLKLTGEEDLIRRFEMMKGLKGILL